MPPYDPDTEIGTNLAPKWKIWVDDFSGPEINSFK
jgi:hypothetical protein